MDAARMDNEAEMEDGADGQSKIDAKGQAKAESETDGQEGLSPETAEEGLSPDAAEEGLSPETAEEGLSPETAEEGLSPETAEEGLSPETENERLRTRVAALETELVEVQSRTNAAIARWQEQAYWLDRWHLDLNALMRKPGAVELLGALRAVRGVWWRAKLLKRRLLGPS